MDVVSPEVAAALESLTEQTPVTERLLIYLLRWELQDT